jgi:hypothetical protein
MVLVCRIDGHLELINARILEDLASKSLNLDPKMGLLILH